MAVSRHSTKVIECLFLLSFCSAHPCWPHSWEESPQAETKQLQTHFCQLSHAKGNSPFPEFPKNVLKLTSPPLDQSLWRW